MEFGVEPGASFTGHVTMPTHLGEVPGKRHGTYYSVDDTTIRVWSNAPGGVHASGAPTAVAHGEAAASGTGEAEELAKVHFPTTKRQLVSAMTAFELQLQSSVAWNCAFLCADVDRTFKLYSEKLDLLEIFKSEQKVTSLGAIEQKGKVIILVGSDQGLDAYDLIKSSKRRLLAFLRHEYHYQLTFSKKLHASPILKFIIAPKGEALRLVAWSSNGLYVFNDSLSLVAQQAGSHSGQIRCVALQMKSLVETMMLSGSEDCTVKVWTLSHLQQSGQAIMRAVHTFRGHSKSVEVTWFGSQTNDSLQLCFSVGLDDKIKVWSLQECAMVYTIDMNLLHSKGSKLFSSKTPGEFAICTHSEKHSRIRMVRFTSEVSEPLATTNHCSVVLFGRLGRVLAPKWQAALPLVTEDQTLRVLNCQLSEMVAVLPPPPQGSVQVERVYVANNANTPIVVLGLSSREVAVFRLPSAEHDAELSTTPVLVRRFHVRDVGVEQGERERDLYKEPFSAMSIYHGSLMKQGLEVSLFEAPRKPDPPQKGDFMILGTILGTLIVLRLKDITESGPIELYTRYVLPHSQLRDVFQAGESSFVCVDVTALLVVWDLSTVTKLFEHRLSDPVFAPYIVNDAVAGVCVGADVKIELFTPTTVRQASSSHAKRVLQLDYCQKKEVFVSIGQDCAVKLWEAPKLHLLISVTYPTPLTAVAFRPMSDGDVLLGFSNHVEVMKATYWWKAQFQDHEHESEEDALEWSDLDDMLARSYGIGSDRSLRCSHPQTAPPAWQTVKFKHQNTRTTDGARFDDVDKQHMVDDQLGGGRETIVSGLPGTDGEREFQKMMEHAREPPASKKGRARLHRPPRRDESVSSLDSHQTMEWQPVATNRGPRLYNNIGALLALEPTLPARIAVEPYVPDESFASRHDLHDTTVEIPIIETPFVDSCGRRDICLRGHAEPTDVDIGDVVVVTSIGRAAHHPWSPRDVNRTNPHLQQDLDAGHPPPVADIGHLRERKEMVQVDHAMWVAKDEFERCNGAQTHKYKCFGATKTTQWSRAGRFMVDSSLRAITKPVPPVGQDNAMFGPRPGSARMMQVMARLEKLENAPPAELLASGRRVKRTVL
eukprot:GEMP01002028.1.p1 GENE.GEMP01002028.1~~GEMP01002028.1.p1  ORF type:complete len:1105 (+),score=284.28 GEMP01002028.1:172-3486(+)